MARSWRDTYSGGFLKSKDLPVRGKKFKLGAVEEESLAKGERPKLIADLEGEDARLVLNATNAEMLEEFLGSEDPDDWEGASVVLFNDRSVRGPNGEKGGIRVKDASKPGKKKRRKLDPEPDEDDEDSDLDEFEEDDDE